MTNLNKDLKYIMCHIIWVISWQKNQYSKIWNSNQKIIEFKKHDREYCIFPLSMCI